jgi:spore maturation protein CgeB
MKPLPFDSLRYPDHGPLRVAIFCHSLVSDWNHGNAHFLRGMLADLDRRGAELRVFEPVDAWSRQNLERDHGPAASRAYREAYPRLHSRRYDPDSFATGPAVEAGVAWADVLVVHEWTDPAVVAEIGRAHAGFETRPGARAPRVLLFHDTHHRCVSAPREMERFDLNAFDGVLAFGEPVRQWHRQNHRLPARTFHEAAATDVFRPRPEIKPEADLVWIGNWGDDERTAELHEFLIEPVADLGLSATVYGVRYPDHAVDALAKAGIRYGGYLPNHKAPQVFARHRVTVHVPRRFYTTRLPGIPTIRPFEAMACGIPLVSAPWDDTERLFGEDDYLKARDGHEMRAMLRDVIAHPQVARARAKRARQTILNRHTCAHRVDELLATVDDLHGRGSASPAHPSPPRAVREVVDGLEVRA